MLSISRWLGVFALVASLLPVPSFAETAGLPDSAFKAMRYRSIGPFRGGRSAAVAGIPDQPFTYYFGASGGGVWKTPDGGNTWNNVSDGYFGGSIGAIAVSTWDPNVVYVGGGEVTVRGNVSHGNGVWKSTDAGQTWQHIGLADTRHIPRIRIHPKNPDLVYVAALGHLYGPNAQRGVFRSRDGGKTWERVLFINNEVGACDLLLDPNNPRVIYASTWRVKRTPYSLESGGDGCGLWKSSDGGDTWSELTRNPGLPKGMVGIIGVAVSPVDSKRVWAIIEAKDGGVFRSQDAGETWQRINSERKLRQRAWYYTRIYADPQDRDQVYVVNVRFFRSKDGGKSFTSISTPHGDHHDLWIAPENPRRMIIADDGGAQVSTDAGANWTTYMNQATAQFYRVTTDSHVPYRIYGAQQDNSTVRIVSRSNRFSIGERDWEPTAGGESGHLAPHPKNPDIVYGGSYAGYLERYNHRTGFSRNINAWPDDPIGHGAADQKYRFQWNFPIFFSPHDANTLYTAANVLFKTTDEGQTWVPISPDLTRNDPTKLGPSGGPITKDNTTVEYYCTIFAALESPHEPGVLWVGSDDGLIHLTRNGGEKWENVTPPGLPEWSQINSIEAHPTEKGGLYVAATRYKLDDFRPYIFKTLDYGKTWKAIDSGIAHDHFTRVIRADPDRAGLLYAGTEAGMYISFDDGDHWQPFQLNLPIVPITDLAIKNQDLIVATQGRSFWVLDDLTPLHQLTPAKLKQPAFLCTPRPCERRRGGFSVRALSGAGQNPPAGAVMYFHLKEKPAEDTPMIVEILDSNEKVVQRYSTKPKQKEQQLPELEVGLNRLIWNLRYPGAETFPGMVLWGGGTSGPKAVPGDYQVRLCLGERTQKVPLTIRKDPRSQVTQEDLEAQFTFLMTIRDRLTETHRAIKRIRDVREQINALLKRVKEEPEMEAVCSNAKKMIKQLSAIEEALYQTKNQSAQDPLNFPIRLNNKLASVGSVAAQGDYRPTASCVAVAKDISTKIDIKLAELQRLLDKQLPKLNKQFRKAKIPAIFPGESGKRAASGR